MHISSQRKNLLDNFVEKFNLSISDFSMLDCALTHGSYVKEHNLKYHCSYERLEFLGDAVLKISISEFLFKNFPDSKEGELTQFRALIVSDKILSEFAKKIKLSELILLSNAEIRQKGSEKSSILACSFEALLGAIFLQNGLAAVNDFLFSNFEDEIKNAIVTSEFSNPKAILQEYTQGENNELPVYTTVEEIGSAHNKTFKVQVTYKGQTLALGEGKSKKEAQQNGARNALIKLNLIKGDENG